MSTPEAPATCPVHSFNHQEEAPFGARFARYDKLRDEAPIIKNEYPNEHFVVTRYEDILAVFQDAETFSSSAVEVLDPNPSYKWIPEMLDGDEHFQWRRQLGPLFSPKSISKLDDKVRERTITLIDEIAKGDSCNFMEAFAFQFPTSIFLDLMGLPASDLKQFMAWEHEILRVSAGAEETHERQAAAMGAVNEYFSSIIAERRVTPGDDLISHALAFTIDGEPVTDSDMGSFCLLMFMAGLDTVSSTLGLIFMHFANNPDDRKRIVDDPSLIPSAIEELIRAYAIVMPSRKAMSDTEVAGCPIRAGQMVNLPLNAATRDGSVFEDATSVIIDRSPNNHIGFGAGPHRCLGSHLARRELKIALEEWHKRIPDYRLREGAAPKDSGAMIGLDEVPLVWD